MTTWEEGLVERINGYEGLTPAQKADLHRELVDTGLFDLMPASLREDLQNRDTTPPVAEGGG